MASGYGGRIERFWEEGKFHGRKTPVEHKGDQDALCLQLKRGADGEIEVYKTRLVARILTQRPGVDFFETFAPDLGFDVVHTVLAISGMDIPMIARSKH